MPADSILIGRGVQTSGPASGKIILGNNIHHTSLQSSVSESVTLRTGTGSSLTTSLSLSPFASELRANGTTTLACCTRSIQINTNTCVISNTPLILSNPVVCDSDGKSIFGIGSSKHIGGRSDGFPGASVETRRIAIGVECYHAEDDSSTRQPHILQEILQLTLCSQVAYPRKIVVDSEVLV